MLYHFLAKKEKPCHACQILLTVTVMAKKENDGGGGGCSPKEGGGRTGEAMCERAPSDDSEMLKARQQLWSLTFLDFSIGS